MSGNGAIELILLVMIAGFLVLRLRSILGRRVGFERATPGEPARAGSPPVIDAMAEPVTPSRELPGADTPPGQALAAMRQTDPAFDPQRFLSGAEAAFRMIVAAFARGDRDALRPLLDADTFASFETAIAAREQAGETQSSEVRAIPAVSIVNASLGGSLGSIAVRFVSDQVSTTIGRDGNPVQGTDAVTELTDVWTFERDFRQRDPAWRLTAAQSG